MAEKIPVLGVLKQALRLLRDDAVVVVILFGLPVLAESAVTVFLLQPLEPATALYSARFWCGFGLFLLLQLVAVPSMSAWYRRVILGPPLDGGIGWRIGRAEWLLLRASVRVIVYSLPMIAVLAWILYFRGHGNAQLAHGRSVYVMFLGSVFCLSSMPIPVAIMSMDPQISINIMAWMPALLLTLSGSALGRSLTFRDATAMVEGNFLGVMILLCLIPWGLELVVGACADTVVGPVAIMAMVTVLLAAATLFTTCLTATLTALCYRHLAGPPATADNAAGAPSPELG
ncbi:MAG TPA: hypothetical protein VK558_16010 [Patescibacteria group bacterium]|nr:hypothetical protein [Patescibacteria group bacterium]